ncbi:hypothetical protein HJG53_15795 [Sphingomonas sp. ID1715]|uniref:hypothetical protein n=1 Tax=Sphingomonas sp. ID1715 TaxID=1656898 RepID=UPI00185741C8|nr:hypothetical protein [Sphingomonas sp. ID1715]NNM78354.1 hypothetical protein [Sphingomonas sp. ID1715]
MALSVASVTEAGNVRLTVDRMLEFDEAKIGFTHAHTWAAMPAARRGVIKSTSAHIVFPGTHPRVEACIRALCELGERDPVETKRFADFPQSGLTTSRQIEWGPEVVINVKAVCWYVKDGVPIIPLLQPRKVALLEEKLSLYATLGLQAYCKGDWATGSVEIVDLSGEDEVFATLIPQSDLKPLSETRVDQYVQTYLEAKQIADRVRAERPKQQPKPRGDDLFNRPS